jgi:acyl-CoA synthetase (AMP-forming)/AMP-acid ligase II/pimeloyl-ACP methyl ester carboxylesterase
MVRTALPSTLPGIDPAWSRFVDVDVDGGRQRFHALDRRLPDPAGTIVCVHGNPTWAYLWRDVLAECGSTHRVVAVDQLGMGFSARGPSRSLAQRVADLGAVLAALEVEGDVTLVAHDWGGPVALGWAAQHRERLAALVLANTGVEMPARGLPALIRLANVPGVRDLVCRRTSLFLRVALALSPSLTAQERAAYRAPYRSRRRRRAIAEFVADIPIDSSHPSAATLAAIAAATAELEVPTLLVWGARDPVFTDVTLADLRRRLPHAQVARYPSANHLVPEDVALGPLVRRWLSSRPVDAPTGADDRPMTAVLQDRAATDPQALAVVDLGAGTTVTAAELHDLVRRIATGLQASGADRGDRIALLAPVGVTLLAAVYACWCAGLVPVVVDRGLGLRGIRRALRSTQPRFALTDRRTSAVARLTRLVPSATVLDLAQLAGHEPGPEQEPPGPDDVAAVVFTSGATGPAKGVRYTHGQLLAQRRAMATTFGVASGDALVAAFAPFAVFGPALGIPVAIPDMDVTRPSTLRPLALADACRAVGATLVFASPAALASVAASDVRVDGVRTVLSAGAPVPADVVSGAGRVFPGAAIHTPYGMTEVLLVTTGADPRPPERGVHVGPPVEGAEVLILPLDFDPASPPQPLPEGETGEIVVSAPWCSAGYDGLWQLEVDARFCAEGRTWHRTGDVGHLERGELWIEGRVVHVVRTGNGPVTPVGMEEALRAALGSRAAVVGVGPPGKQALVVVLESPGPEGVVEAAAASAVRHLVGDDVAAVCRRKRLPVDIRHNSKVDRTAVARWAESLLQGR